MTEQEYITTTDLCRLRTVAHVASSLYAEEPRSEVLRLIYAAISKLEVIVDSHHD